MLSSALEEIKVPNFPPNIPQCDLSREGINSTRLTEQPSWVISSLFWVNKKFEKAVPWSCEHIEHLSG